MVLELKEILKKKTIKRTQPPQREFLSKLFLVGKKGGAYYPVINLKMNQLIPFLHFKMEGISQLKHNAGKRLDVQIKPKGCILQCPIGSKLR